MAKKKQSFLQETLQQKGTLILVAVALLVLAYLYAPQGLFTNITYLDEHTAQISVEGGTPFVLPLPQTPQGMSIQKYPENGTINISENVFTYTAHPGSRAETDVFVMTGVNPKTGVKENFTIHVLIEQGTQEVAYEEEIAYEEVMMEEVVEEPNPNTQTEGESYSERCDGNGNGIDHAGNITSAYSAPRIMVQVSSGPNNSPVYAGETINQGETVTIRTTGVASPSADVCNITTTTTVVASTMPTGATFNGNTFSWVATTNSNPTFRREDSLGNFDEITVTITTAPAPQNINIPNWEIGSDANNIISSQINSTTTRDGSSIEYQFTFSPISGQDTIIATEAGNPGLNISDWDYYSFYVRFEDSMGRDTIPVGVLGFFTSTDMITSSGQSVPINQYLPSGEWVHVQVPTPLGTNVEDTTIGVEIRGDRQNTINRLDKIYIDEAMGTNTPITPSTAISYPYKTNTLYYCNDTQRNSYSPLSAIYDPISQSVIMQIFQNTTDVFSRTNPTNFDTFRFGGGPTLDTYYTTYSGSLPFTNIQLAQCTEQSCVELPTNLSRYNTTFGISPVQGNQYSTQGQANAIILKLGEDPRNSGMVSNYSNTLYLIMDRPELELNGNSTILSANLSRNIGCNVP
jgi:hypothetical protein